MASTRSATGNSKPRQFLAVATEPASRKKTGTTKKKATTTKKPAAKKTSTGRVTKHKPTVGDKVKGAVEKAKGVVERKPGKRAAGTREMRGEDGKKKKTAIKKKVGAPKKSAAKTEVDVKVKT